MVFRMAAGRHEHDRNAITRIRIVVAAAVVLSRMPVRVIAVIELERGRELLAFHLDDVAELRRQSSRSNELQVARASAWRKRAWAATDHVDVDLSHDGIAWHRGMVGEVPRAEHPFLLRDVPYEQNRPLRLLLRRGKSFRDLEHAHRARAIVVGAVEDRAL